MEAEAAYRKQIEVRSDDPFAHKNLGILLIKLGRDREAIPELQAAVRISPKDALPLVVEGEALLHLGNEQAALAAFGHAMEQREGMEARNDVAYQLALAGVALDQARTWAAEAITAAEATLTPGPKAVEVRTQVAATSTLAARWDTLGWVLYRKGDLTTAQTYLEAASRLGGQAEVADHLGQVRAALGDQADAAVARTKREGGQDLEIPLPATGMEPGTADFEATLAPGGKVVEARIHSGLEAMNPLSKALLEVHHPFLFPRDSSARLVVIIRVVVPRGAKTATVRFLDGKEALVSLDPSPLGSISTPTPALIPAELTKKWAGWAGPEGVARGFTPDRIQAYLEAWRISSVAPLPGAIRSWLKDLSESPVPSLSAWALARRLEAGDFTAFEAYQIRMFDHIYAISKPGSHKADAVLRDPPLLARTLAVDPDAPFWATYLKGLRSRIDEPMGAGLYAVWCYGTRPDQRALILEEAAHVKPAITITNPSLDPWNDPRFWIVVDWALAWGQESDFKTLAEALPQGPARSEFIRIHQRVGRLQGFWGIVIPPAQPSHVSEAPFKAGTNEVRPLLVKIQPRAPAYPEEGKARRMMSVIQVALTVGADGVPLGAKLLPGPWLAFFGPTAYAYGLDWRFEPAQWNGVPQASRFLLTMPFTLK